MIITRLVGLVILGALLVVYVPHVRHATFVYEDDRALTTGVWAAPLSWVTTIRAGRGLTGQSWRVIRTPSSAHALNLALHALNVLLTGLLFWQIRRDRWVALGAASIMALHPLTIEGVAYATSRAELLAACGAVTALVCVTSGRRAWIVLMPVALLVSYTGKETGLVAIGLIPLVLWLQGARRWAAGLLAGVVAIGAATVAIAWPTVVRIVTQGQMPGTSIDSLSWGLIQAAAVWRLVILSVWPAWLSPTPDVPPSLLLGIVSAVFLIALLECAWRARSRAPLFTAGVLWCAIVAAPRFLVRTPLSPFNEHQWYLAMPGVACVLLSMIEIVAAWCEARWGRRLCPA